jgi:NSS family neurotransmitter:Na+ symporter
MIAYASYLPRKTDLNVNACVIAAVDTLVAFTAGLAVFSTLGYMSGQMGKPVDQIVQQSIGLAFVAYPKAISLLPNFAPVFGAIFFSVLIFAGITSSISIVEAFTSAVVDKFHYSRKVLVTILSMVGFLGGIIFATGGGLAWLDIVDHFLSHYGLFAACFLQCVVVGWRYGAKPLREHVNSVSSFQWGRVLDVLIKYVAPGVLACLFVNDLVKDLRQPYEHYPWLALVLIGRDWLLLTLIAALFVAMRPWRKPLR